MMGLSKIRVRAISPSLLVFVALVLLVVTPIASSQVSKLRTFTHHRVRVTWMCVVVGVGVGVVLTALWVLIRILLL